MVRQHLMGLLKVRVLRGVNLATRDLTTSDPYLVLRLGKQRLRTWVVKKNTNPLWNEDLTVCVEDPSLPVRLVRSLSILITSITLVILSRRDVFHSVQQVFDKDRFSLDDAMGHAEFDMRPFLEAVRVILQGGGGVSEGSIIKKLMPSGQNCLAEESAVRWCGGQVTQDLVLGHKNVECGEVELQLQWVDIPSAKGL